MRLPAPHALLPLEKVGVVQAAQGVLLGLRQGAERLCGVEADAGSGAGPGGVREGGRVYG